MITMFFVVLFVLVGLVSLVLSRKTFKTAYDDEYKPTWLIIVAGVMFLFAFVTLLFGSAYKQDPGEAVVIKGSGGDIVKIDTTAGWGFTAPWNSMSTFNIRNQRIEMFSNSGGEGNDGAAITAPTENGSNATVSITVRYSILPESVGEIYRTHRSQDNLLDNVLKPGLRDEVRQVTADYSAFDIKQARGEMSAAILEALEERYAEDGVEVDAVDLGDIQLDQATEEALQRVNARQAEVEEAEAALSRARVQAETTKTEAQAQADADQILRCGATTTVVQEEVNGEMQDVVKVTPKTGTDCENRLNEQVLINNYIDALESLGEHGNVVVVPNDLGGGIINVPAPQPAG